MLHEQLSKLLVDCSENRCASLLGGRRVDDYINKITQNAEILTWHHAGELCAFVAFYANDDAARTAFITMVAVMQKHRRKNIATILVNSALSIIAFRGYRKCRLQVGIHNAGAIRLYQSIGFAKVSKDAESLTLEIDLKETQDFARK